MSLWERSKQGLLFIQKLEPRSESENRFPVATNAFGGVDALAAGCERSAIMTAEFLISSNLVSVENPLRLARILASPTEEIIKDFLSQVSSGGPRRVSSRKQEGNSLPPFLYASTTTTRQRMLRQFGM